MKHFLEKVQKNGPTGREKKKIRQNNRARQKNKRGDSKVESNDSPEIRDKGETSDIPGLASGLARPDERETCPYCFSLRPFIGLRVV